MCAPSARHRRRDAATSDGRGGHDPGGGGDSCGGDRGSLPQPRSPRRVHVVWNRKTRKRDTGSEGSGAEPVIASPPPTALPSCLPARRGGGRPRSGPRCYWSSQNQGGAHAKPPLVRHEAGRCLGRAAISPRWSWAVPGPGNSARVVEPGGGLGTEVR